MDPEDLRGAVSNRERRKSIREEVGTSRSSPLARARAARDPEIDVAAPSPAPNYPLLAAGAGQPQRTRFAAGTAIFNRESRRISREEVGTSRSSPPRARPAQQEASGRRRGALFGAQNPTHC